MEFIINCPLHPHPNFMISFENNNNNNNNNNNETKTKKLTTGRCVQLSQIPEAAAAAAAAWQMRAPGPYGPAAASGAGSGRTAGAGCDECERLCLEADQLLERSRQHEERADLDAAFGLCQSAAQRARKAMDA